MTGVVRVVNKARGFALIRTDDGCTYFAHVYQFLNQLDFDFLTPGAKIEFLPYTDPEGGGNGLRASEIRFIPEA